MTTIQAYLTNIQPETLIKLVLLFVAIIFIGKKLEKTLLRMKRLTKKGRKCYRQAILFSSSIPLAKMVMTVIPFQNVVLTAIVYFLVYKIVKKNRKLLRLV